MKTFEQLKPLVRAAWDAQGDYREEMRKDDDFKNGHQWTPEEISAFDETQRASIVFNRVAPIIASVAGSEINNRTEVRFVPREIGDAKPNEILTAGAEWFRDESNAEDEDSQAFEDMLTTGIGFTETYMDFEVDPDGAPAEQRIPPWEMGWDAHAHRKGLTDSGLFFRVRQIPIDEARGMWPDAADDADLNATWLKVGGDEVNTRTRAPYDQYAQGDDGEASIGDGLETVTVVQVQYRERVRSVEYMDPATGQRAEMAIEQWERLAAVAGEMLPQHRVMTKLVWRQAFLGNVILAESQPCEIASTFRPITGHWDRKDKRFYGILRGMKDPQKFANKWLSQTLHILAVNAKGGVMVDQNGVDDMRAFEESWAAADSVTFVNRLDAVAPKPSPQMPTALMQLTEFAIGSIRDVSGVSLELMGMREASQAGVLEYQRRQSSMTTLAYYFDSLRFYRKQQGDVILWFLQKWVAPTGRLVRLVKQGLQQYVPLAVDSEARRYDVIVDDSPQAPNEKERSWQVIERMLPMLQNAGLSMEDWAMVMDYSPLPTSFADMLRTKAEEAKANPPQPDPAQMADLENTKAQAMERQASAMYKQAQAAKLGQPEPQENSLRDYDTPAEIHARVAKDMTAAQLNAARAGAEAAKPALERQKLIADMMRGNARGQ